MGGVPLEGDTDDKRRDIAQFKLDFTKTRVSMKQGGRTIIEKIGGHPIGNPGKPAVVLANLRRMTTGLEAGSGTHYIPKWSEVAITLSIVAAGFAIFHFVAQNFPVFEPVGHEPALASQEETEEDPVAV